jgi:hypothetical protein
MFVLHIGEVEPQSGSLTPSTAENGERPGVGQGSALSILEKGTVGESQNTKYSENGRGIVMRGSFEILT